MEQRRSWFARNWFWVVPVGCLPMCVCSGCLLVPLVVVHTAITGSAVFAEAMTAVRQSPEIQEVLGEPIDQGGIWGFQGNFKSNNNVADADVQFPISGPKGSGKVHFKAHKDGGPWEFEFIKVTVSGQSEPIYVKGEPAGNE